VLGRLIGRLRGSLDSDAALGRAGERASARFLRRAGYRVLDRNVRLDIGEADIVCLAPDRETIVIVEVKTRRRGAGRSILGETVPPEASVHQAKRRKLLAVARALASANGWKDRRVRIDVIGVEWPSDGSKPTLRHHEGAVGR
jgi:putative endonuclease